MPNAPQKRPGLSLSSKLLCIITPLLVLLSTNLGIMFYFPWKIWTNVPTIHAASLLKSGLLTLHVKLAEYCVGRENRKEIEELQGKVRSYLYYLRDGNKALDIRESPGRLDEPGYQNLWWNWDRLIRQYGETCQPLILNILEAPEGKERETLLLQYDGEMEAFLSDVGRAAMLTREHFVIKPFTTFPQIAIGLFIASMVGTGVTFLLIRLLIKRPLRDVVEGMQEVARGKWGKTVEVKSRDELGQVAQSFNYLSTELEKTIKTLEEANKMLQESSYKDFLTGLYNCYYFHETLQVEYRRANRHAFSLSLIMLDVDGFKHINDTLGHTFGNFVLQEMGKRIRDSIRGIDIAYRYGGEEFAVLLPQTDYEGAKKVSQRLKENLCETAYRNDVASCNITVTQGIASLEEAGVKEAADLVKLADEAMLEGKSRGGNCAVLASQVHRGPEVDVTVLEDYRRKLATTERNLKKTYMDSTAALLRALEGKDGYTAVHSCLVATYALHFAETLKVPPEEREAIKNAALLHDLGKISIPGGILRKEEELTSEEFSLVKQHPHYSVSIIKGARFLEHEMPIILHHHERWDGQGYPSGLQGRNIPLGARILALADAYEAMTSPRPYRKTRSPEEVFRVLREEAGHQFDPELVEPFIKSMKEFLSTTRRVYIAQLDRVVEIASSQ